MGEYADLAVDRLINSGYWLGRSNFRSAKVLSPPAKENEFPTTGDDMGRKENLIENYLRDEVKKLGGEHRKVVYQGRTGSPDDWCFLPGGVLLIVECKAEKAKPPTKQQLEEIDWLCGMGFNASWVSTKAQIDKLLAPYKELDFL